jgi:PHD/YefM family antitoxin component YafN of YafNO toxin-antitoxin module
MSYVSYTAFRDRLADYMDEVCNDSTAIHVTRQGARSGRRPRNGKSLASFG